jgi:hypothetical protein
VGEYSQDAVVSAAILDIDAAQWQRLVDLGAVIPAPATSDPAVDPAAAPTVTTTTPSDPATDTTRTE